MQRQKRILGSVASILIALGTMTLDAPAQTVTATIQVGGNPQGVALDPITNKIYVADLYINGLAIIDGATNAVTNVPNPAGASLPFFVAINTVTNKIYEVNENTSNVTVVDGATNSTTLVAVRQ